MESKNIEIGLVQIYWNLLLEASCSPATTLLHNWFWQRQNVCIVEKKFIDYAQSTQVEISTAVANQHRTVLIASDFDSVFFL